MNETQKCCDPLAAVADEQELEKAPLVRYKLLPAGSICTRTFPPDGVLHMKKDGSVEDVFEDPFGENLTLKTEKEDSTSMIYRVVVD